MAYRKNHHRVLAGGLSLVPPGDKIQDADSLLLTNWRVDQAGALRSRKGLNSLGTIAGARIHTLYRRHPSTRYAGAGTALYSGSPAPTNSIATGFDGNPLGIVSAGGWAWIMNRSKQVKDDGTNVRNWTPAAPASGPSVSADSVTTAVAASFDATETWDVIDPDGTSTAAVDPFAYPAGFDASNAHLGESLHIECNPLGTWQARRTYASPVDLGLNGEQRDDDEFRIWVYASDPAAVDEVVVSIDVNGGDFKDDYYTVTFPGALLNPVRFSWSFLVARRRTIGDTVASTNPEYLEVLRQSREAREAGEDQRAILLEQQLAELRENLLQNTPGFVRTGSTTAKDWSTAKGIRVQVRVNDACDVHFDQAEFFGGDNANLRGAYYWYVTFDTDDGHESNPSPASSELTLDGRAAALSSIPVSADAQVTKRHIYRAGGTLGKAWRVKTIGNNTDTTATDDTSDEDAQNLGIEMEEDHDPAPACSGAIAAYGRILAYSSAANPSRYWWTPVGKYWYFPGAAADDFEAANWQDAGEDGDAILFATTRRRVTIFYKNRTIWRLAGDPDTTDPEMTSAKRGTVGPRAVADAGTVDYFVAADGLYRFNGDFEELMFPKISPIFRNEYVTLTEDGIQIAPVDDTNRAACVLEFAANKLFFSYPEVGNSTPTATLVCDLLTGNVMMHRVSEDYANTNQGFSALHNEGHQRDLIGAVYNGTNSHIVEIDQNSDDEGNAIFAQWLSGYQDFGLPDNEKTLGEVVIDFQSAIDGESPADSLTVKLYYDNGQTTVSLGSISSADRTKVHFKVGSNGEGAMVTNVAILIEGTLLKTTIIYGVYFHWYAEEREGVSFDTGISDSGSPLLKQVTELEFEVETAASVSWRLYSDMPGNVMTYRDGNTIAHAAGDRPLRVLLTNPVEGFRHRITMNSASAFRLRKLRWRARLVGEFIDGVSSDTWQSFELPLGNGGVEEFKEAVIYYQAASGANLEIYTDQPGGSMALRQTIALPAASGYRSYRYPLDGTPFEGAAVRFKLTSAGPAYLYGGWIRTRTIGLYIDGSKGEKWLQQVSDGGTFPQVKLYREVEWDIAITGQLAQGFSTEQPGGALTTRQTDTLNASGTLSRRPVEVRLGGTTKGKLFQILLSGTGTARVYRGRVLVKDLGGANPTAWRWIGLPIPPTADDYNNVTPLPVRQTTIEPEWVTLPLDAIE